jgi:Flp pilus assembly protein TadG
MDGARYPWLRGPVGGGARSTRPGQVLPLMAFAIVVLIGFTGLAVDGGMVFVTRSRLQHTVDAAALAGAQDLPTTASARTAACSNLQVNVVPGMTASTDGLTVSGSCSGIPNGNANIDLTVANTITVTAYRRVTPTFGAVLDFVPKVVGARATVIIGSVGVEDCVFPLFIQEGEFASVAGVKYAPKIFVVPDGAVIDEEAPNNGSVAIREAMADECSYEGEVHVGDEMDVKTGSLTQFKDGWVQRRTKALAESSQCKNPYIHTYLDANQNLDPTLTFENCPRLILAPIVPTANYGGNDEAEILGFTPFWFADVCENNGCTYNIPGYGTLSVPRHRAWGYFVDMDMVSPEYTNHNPYGTKTVVLTN